MMEGAIPASACRTWPLQACPVAPACPCAHHPTKVRHGAPAVCAGHDVPGEGEHKIMEYIRWQVGPRWPHSTQHSHEHAVYS